MLWKAILEDLGAAKGEISTLPLHLRGENAVQHHGLALSLIHKAKSPMIRLRKREFLSPHPFSASFGTGIAALSADKPSNDAGVEREKISL